MMPRDVSTRLQIFEKAPDNRTGDYVLDANDSFLMTMAFEGALGVIHASRHAIVSMTPPSTLNAAPVVAEESGEAM